MSDRSWPAVLAAAMSGARPDDVAWAMDRILEDQATSAQIAAFVTALRMHGETPPQLSAMIDSLMTHGVTVPRASRPPIVVDVVGTGGDGSDSVNISTMSSVVVAAAGAPVIKHGNRAASSATGSADALEALGVAIELGPQAVAECVSSVGIAFCFAPAYHPAFRFAGPTRRELGVPTVFNILGPLANPAVPEAMLVGCARAESAPVMAQVLADRGTRALVVRGEDGLDEISIGTTSQVWDATGSTVVEVEIDPRDWGVPRFDTALLRGGSADRNVELLKAALDPDSGAADDKIEAIRSAVIVNAAAALTAYDAAEQAPNEDVASRIGANIARARRALESGDAWALVQRWAAESRRLAS